MSGLPPGPPAASSKSGPRVPAPLALRAASSMPARAAAKPALRAASSVTGLKQTSAFWHGVVPTAVADSGGGEQKSLLLEGAAAATRSSSAPRQVGIPYTRTSNEIPIVVCLNLQKAFFVPSGPGIAPNRIRLDSNECERLCGLKPGGFGPLDSFLSWARLKGRTNISRATGLRTATNMTVKGSPVHVVHSMLTYNAEDAARMRSDNNEYCVRGTRGHEMIDWTDSDPSTQDKPFGSFSNEHILEHRGLMQWTAGKSLMDKIDSLKTQYSPKLGAQATVKVAVIGVWTEHIVHVVSYLISNGIDVSNIATCTSLQATAFHSDGARSYLEDFLRVQSTISVVELVRWLRPQTSLPDLPRLPVLNVCPEVTFEGPEGEPVKGTDTDKMIVYHLFRKAKSVHLHTFGVGFSDATVYLASSRGADGVEHAPTIVKVASNSSIAKEAENIRAVTRVVGVACPPLICVAEHGDKAGLRCSLATVVAGGRCRALKSLWPSGTSAESGDGDELAAADAAIIGIQTALSCYFTRIWSKFLRNADTIDDDPFILHGFRADPEGVRGEISYNWCQEGILTWLNSEIINFSAASAAADGDAAAAAAAPAAAAAAAAAGGVQPTAPTTLSGAVRRLLNCSESHDYAGNVQTPNAHLGDLEGVQELLRVLDGMHNGSLEAPGSRTPWCLIHGDLHADNFLLDENANVFIIDHDTFAPGNPFSDSAHLEAFAMFELVIFDFSLPSYCCTTDTLTYLSLVV